MASVHQRYRIIQKIDVGGMAEIYRGVQVSLEGFEKEVAIKRILPSLTDDQKFVSMFLDEARLSMQLNHANIVQIFDIGSADDTYFIVMEFVDGLNLRRLMQRAVDQGVTIPVPLACYMIMEVAKALAYAHEKRDPQDQPLGLVHRDVSPPNVMVSHQGEVKLTDFGLAKATTQVERTDSGVVKGKFAYLSPEAVDGKDVDARADIFSCGTVLWEMLAGRSLFTGLNELDTIDRVHKASVPPVTSVRDDADTKLDKIMARVLARNPKRRYQTARALEQDLAGYLFDNGLRVTASDIAEFVRGLHEDRPTGVPGAHLGQLLQSEIDGLIRTGSLDSTLGQKPMRAADLRSPGASRFRLDPLMQQLASLSGEDLADSEGASGILALADRLEGAAPSADASASRGVARGGGGRRIVWLAAAVAAVAALTVAAWQAGLIGGP